MQESSKATGTVLLVLAAVLTPPGVVRAADTVVDLSGVWAFQLDPDDRGLAERWYGRSLSRQIRLPGSLQAQGFGCDVSVATKWTGGIVDRSWFTEAKYAKHRRPGCIKVPFWLQPDKHYVGVAWYQRDVETPSNWRGRRVVLTLERPHWETRVWIDGRAIGSNNSLGTPHDYELPASTFPGRRRLTVRVDNRMIVDVGENAHSVSDHTQTNWNGIVGRLVLTARAPIWIDDVQVFPDVARKAARVKLRLGNATGSGVGVALKLSAKGISGDSPHSAPAKAVDVQVAPSGTSTEVDYPLGEDAPCWDEFTPSLLRLLIDLKAKDRAAPLTDHAAATFGLREFRVAGTQFAINGRKTFIRGTLECCVFPRTGYPPTDVASWRRVIGAAKRHGLNAIRFHSWCPPEAAFVAADELGFYFQVECGAWATIGQGKPIDDWLYAEAARILRAYGNHPSFVMMAYGNEPGGRHREFLAKWVTHWRQKDPRRLYTGAAGWPEIAENQYHNLPKPRIQGWGAGLRSRINARPPETRTDYSRNVRRSRVPIVSHEIGQWCVYPNFDEIAKYTGVLKARNFEIFRETLQANHMGDQARDFLMASGKLQTLCYKEDIESALRTPGFGGFHLLDLHDFPGQGTALVGVLDAFWDSKGYVSPEAFRRFCNATVPLARMDKRYWTASETFKADIELAHFGPGPLKDASPVWKLVGAGGRTVTSGRLSARSIPVGNGIALGTVEIDLSGVVPAQKYTFVVGLEATPFENDWDIWVFPEHIDVAAPPEVLVTHRLDGAAQQRLKAGGKVLLTPIAADVKTSAVIGFSSIFWNTAWTRGQPPHTLGILCDPKHAVFDRFPTEFHSNWQWWELIHGSAAMTLDAMPPKLRPLVQPIDTWFENRRLALLFEANVLGGKLVVCSMDLSGDLDRRVVARQMRHSVLAHMAGSRFEPTVELTVDQITALFKPPSVMRQPGVRVRADSEAPGHEAAKAIDGDPRTIWHTPWQPRPKPMPHHLTVDLGKPLRIKGLVVLPRQDMANGRIREYAVYVSNEASRWGKPLVAGTWADNRTRQTVRFKRPVSVRYLKLVAKSEVNGNPFAAVAELDLLTD